MKKSVWVLAVGALALFSVGVHSQQPAGATPPAGTGPDLSWAFPVINGKLPPDTPGPKSVKGSSKTYTQMQIDDLFNPPDWFPDAHPAAPAVVTKGHGAVMACGACHLMSGLGHPESAGVAGFTAAYVQQQMEDFKSGVRKDAARMNGIAKEMSDEEIRQSAEYFGSLKRIPWVRVVEARNVPKTMVANGRMRFLLPEGGMEPIGNRIIIVPEDQERALLRDPQVGAGFVAYAPVGSIAKGKALAETGGNGKTTACAICHGEGLKGLGNVPSLANLHPIYIARQLHLFRDGIRNGPDAQLMKKPVAKLTDDDIVALSAYLGSLNP